jgi:hypothetical protein
MWIKLSTKPVYNVDNYVNNFLLVEIPTFLNFYISTIHMFGC